MTIDGEVLKSLLIGREMSHAEAAAEIGVSVGTLAAEASRKKILISEHRARSNRKIVGTDDEIHALRARLGFVHTEFARAHRPPLAPSGVARFMARLERRRPDLLEDRLRLQAKAKAARQHHQE